MRTMKMCAAAAGLVTMAGMAHASPIFSESFDGYSSASQSGGQLTTGLRVNFAGSVGGWANTGQNSIHAVDRANLNSNPVNPANWAVMVWEDTLTLGSAIAGSNVLGQAYTVDFNASAAVYQIAGQATTAAQNLLVQILRADDTVLGSTNIAPGAWTGAMAFSSFSFQYTGDGGSDIRVRIGPSAAGDGRFNGAIDDFAINAVPEGPSLALALLGLVLVGVSRRKR